MSGDKVSVLFVCLGNICRSTMAEGVFRSIVKDKTSPYYDLIGKVDSCGTGTSSSVGRLSTLTQCVRARRAVLIAVSAGGYHTGDEPDSRTLSTLADKGITNYKHAARRLRDSDFKEFDYIFAMDESNLSDLGRWQSRKNANGDAKVMLFGEFSGSGRKEVVQDPYYAGRDAFEKTFQQCKRFSENFLAATFPDVPKPAS
ncbi:Uu.00g095800.m01.CDS01 [Anthostomella pinea]|uniref:protein-tyrosine-phosphatase n=1 Tax=Anthostomella pinea TaxID=933095 RepID=A0AAI8YES8_9PEZI|nr:Uu.00g095800.m01.CDS01 [Anthostomella pinea]